MKYLCTIIVAATFLTPIAAFSQNAAPEDNNLARLVGKYWDAMTPEDRSLARRLGVRPPVPSNDKQSKSKNKKEEKQQVAVGPAAPVLIAPTPLCGANAIFPLLRDDFADIGILSCPKDVGDASGAELSYSRDYHAKNTIWSAHGTAGIVYAVIDDQGPEQITPFYRSLFGYVSIDRASNSDPRLASKNTDTLVGGFSAEFGYRHVLGGEQYFRLRAAAVTDNIQDVTTVSGVAEWIPVYGDYGIGIKKQIGTSSVGFQLNPELIVQYDSTTDATSLLLFSNRRESLRVGPQLSLTVSPWHRDQSFLSRFSSTITYHWAYEAISGRTLYWFQPSITYNLDDAQNFAITTSYRKGYDELTGAFKDLFKVSLTGKI